MEFTPVYVVTLSMLSLAFLLAFIRLVRGPSLADRVVAFDVMTISGMGFIVVYAVSTDQSIFLDVTSVVALMAFLATLAFAYYLRRKA
ncbi:MAG: cation:proton antiporter [Proteobacteria bacterium]|nr:cation:proton antiporter [Pseudomonadota bacterium]MBU4471445.1 cation:proton antiporter [Pseudomonadota bacterium]MCG2752452.1 monovalent cation/H+ antiporter complex subunit F [Desulfobacteraceae bacterium]